MSPINRKNAMKILNHKNSRVSGYTSGGDFLQCLGLMSGKSLCTPKSNYC